MNLLDTINLRRVMIKIEDALLCWLDDYDEPVSHEAIEAWLRIYLRSQPALRLALMASPSAPDDDATYIYFINHAGTHVITVAITQARRVPNYLSITRIIGDELS